jgi:ankyrin repeat protein
MELGHAIYERKIDTDLRLACFKGDIMLVRYLLSTGANIHTHEHDTEDAPFVWACLQNHIELVKILESNGANVNIMNQWMYLLEHNNKTTNGKFNDMISYLKSIIKPII